MSETTKQPTLYGVYRDLIIATGRRKRHFSLNDIDLGDLDRRKMASNLKAAHVRGFTKVVRPAKRTGKMWVWEPTVYTLIRRKAPRRSRKGE